MLKKILYLGWISKGNVGDDLLYSIFKQMLFGQLHDNKILIDIDVYYPISNYEVNLKNYDLIVLGGGSLLTLDFWEDICIKGIDEHIPVVVWGTGIDTRERNLINQIISSYNNNQPIDYLGNKTRKVLTNAILCGVRGRLGDFIINDSNNTVIGDPGIVFNKLNKNLPEIQEINEFIVNDENVILINWGTSYNNIVGFDEQYLEEQLSITTQILLNRGYKIIVYPIWVEDIESCQLFVQKFKNPNIISINKVYDAYGILTLINKAKFSINLKLHASILAFSNGKPFISLGYGLKNYDFVESVELEELNIFTDVVNVSELLRKIDYIEEHYEEIQDKIFGKIEYYFHLQELFMKKLINLLTNSQESQFDE
ncbi:polysaccharide pyruvyl transferase family protein [Peribacillus acanthi]|uniref:polysaccharide pyruvyl transferase family protein n=1 Tax=Peribacillus acanthi TaxID=2171554 RepID=UPI000D3E4EF9|nr:polysaccharide pyruvyl transferase family protein [Peribacillus acanthi]